MKKFYLEDEEMQLLSSIDFSIRKLEEEFRYIEGKEDPNQLQFELEGVYKKEVKSFADRITNDILSIQGKVFEDWTKELETKIEGTDILNSKSWIEKNISIFKKSGEMGIEKLNGIRKERIEDFAKMFNKQFDTKISKEKFSKGDIDFFKEVLADKKATKEIKELIEDIKNINKFKKEDMQKLKDWYRRRSELWARNEAGNIYADQCKELARKNDIEKYKWNTQLDNRVRDTHKTRESKIYSINDSPVPGQEIGCRCYMIPLRNKK